MGSTRREFIKQVGIALGSLALAHCVPPRDRDDSPRGHIRACWGELDGLEERMQRDIERGQKAADQLRAAHRAALDDLVAAGEIEADVAEQVQSAFDEAVYHIQRSMATCYEPVRVDYHPAARGRLIRRAGLLAEMASKGAVDPKVIAQAQAAVERDVAFLSLSPADTEAFYEKLGSGPEFPAFEELELEITPQAAEAARFLVQVLLQD
jgi:hypothetical protein